MMKKIITLCIALLSATLLLAKPYTQQGIAYLYDYKTKTRKPVANVQITVVGAQPTISKDDGTFTLVFDSYGLGDKISFEKQPYYQGMKVFNKNEVDNWFLVKDRLRLIMCRYEEFELVKHTWYDRGKAAAEEKLHAKIKRLEEDLHAGKVREEEYQLQLQQLKEDFNDILDDLRNSADAMARIDQSQVDDQMRHVFDLYEQGYVKEAMKELNDIELDKQLIYVIENKRETEKKLNSAKSDSVDIIANIRSSIPLLELNRDMEKLRQYRKVLADYVGTPSDIFEYAFIVADNDPEEAIRYYQKLLNLLECSKPLIGYDLYLYATAKYNMAFLYDLNKDFELAEHYLEEGIEGRREYAKHSHNPLDEGHISWALVGLVQLYINYYKEMDTELFDKCKLHLDEAISIYKNNFINYESDRGYARCLFVYGRLYYMNHQLKKSEEMLKQAIPVYYKCVEEHPQTIGLELVNTLELLSEVNNDMRQVEDAIKHRREIIDVCSKYIDEFTDVFEPRMAMVLNNFANLYTNLHRYGDAEPMFKEALGIYRRLAEANPNAYNSDISITFGNMSFNTIFMKKYSEAEQLAREGLAVDSTQHFIYTNLAAALLLQGRYSEAGPIYRQYKDELKDAFLDDFKQFKAAGVIPKECEEDVEKIKRMLKE